MSSHEAPPPAAQETCLQCGNDYWLSEANRDRWTIVCPHCGELR